MAAFDIAMTCMLSIVTFLGIGLMLRICTNEIIAKCAPQAGARGFSYKIGLATNKHKGEHMLELTITNEQQIPVTLTPKTLTDKPAKLDGAPVWSVVSGSSTVTPAADGLSAMLVSADEPGTTEYMVKADADLGDGVEEISDIIRLTVAGARAANLGLTAGPAVAKP